jgi:hypothetical protein
MTKDEILSMGLDADEHADTEWPLRPRGDHWKQCRDERFADLVAEKERETCANVCDEQEELKGHTPFDCAAAIRARGQK